MKHAKVLAKAVLRNKDGKILLLRRSKTDVRRPLQWDLPGGGVEDDEDFVAAAAREILEEAGLSIDPRDLHLAFTTADMTDDGNVCWLIFIGRVTEANVTLGFEHDQFQWVSPEKSLEMITYHRQHNALKHIFDNKLFD